MVLGHTARNRFRALPKFLVAILGMVSVSAPSTLYGRNDVPPDQISDVPLEAALLTSPGGLGDMPEAGDMYSSIEDLPAAPRRQFEKIHAEYLDAKQRLEEVTPSELVHARERVAESRDSEALSNSLRNEYTAYTESIKAQGAGAEKDFARWRRLVAESSQADHFVKCDQDTDCREFLPPLARQLILSQVEAAPVNQISGWDLISPLLPEDPTSISEDQATKLLMTWANAVKPQIEDELQKLQQALQPPEAVRMHVVARFRANALFTLFAPYVEEAEKGEVKEWEAKVTESHRRLTAIWPSWERKLKQGPYAYLAGGDAPPVGRTSTLLLINLFVFGIVLVGFVFRKNWARRSAND